MAALDEVPDLDAMIGAVFNAVADYGAMSPERQDAVLAADDQLAVDAAVAAFRRRVTQGRRAAAIRAAPPDGAAAVVLADHASQAQWAPAACLGLATRLSGLGVSVVTGPDSDATTAALGELLRQTRPSADASPGAAAVDLSPALPAAADPVDLATTVAARGAGAAGLRMVLPVRASDGPTTVLVLPDASSLTVWSIAAVRSAGLDIDSPTEQSGTDPVRFLLAIATVPTR